MLEEIKNAKIPPLNQILSRPLKERDCLEDLRAFGREILKTDLKHVERVDWV
jgi:hypothetical protein